MPQNCDVLVTYCWNRVGYNILRSLSDKGLAVYAADTSNRNICSMSKFCAGNFVYPDPFSNEKEFINCLLDQIAVLKPKVLMPTHDEGIIIAKYINLFPKELIIPIESYDKLILLSNKLSATKLAESAGVPIPRIYDDTNDIQSFPVVLKTHIGNSAKGVFFPESVEQIDKIKKKIKDKEFFIEEKIGGSDYSVDCFRWNEHFQASVYRALITKTDGGGTTTQRIIVDEPILVEYAKKILDAVDYKGVCGIDFRYDKSTGKCAFIEVNARFTGGLATQVTAGFDIPYWLYCAAVGRHIDDTTAKIGVKTKWILGDVITFVDRMFSLNFKWKEIKYLLKLSGFDAFDDFRKDDKLAIIGEMSYYLEKLIKNRKLNP